MHKYYCLLLSLFYWTALQSQDLELPQWKEASPESQAYRKYRLIQNDPPYGLQKVKKLIEQIKSDDEGNDVISAKAYQALTLREKFTYHILNPESYNQICDPEYPIQDEQKKIFAHVADDFGEHTWSDRQEAFFKKNRDTVMKLIEQNMLKEKHLGVVYKNVLVIINAKEIIPLLVSTYNIDKKDHDILTLLMLLMRDNKYLPFMESQSCKKLYSDDASYDAFLNFNTANEELIIKRATDFYYGLKK